MRARKPRTGRWPWLLAVVIVSLPPAVHAEQASDADAARRIHFIQDCLDAGTAAADRWWYAWYSIYTGLTLGQAALAVAASDSGSRIDNGFGAFSSSVGLVPLGITPLEARYAAARLRALPEATPAERQTKLVAAERLLRTAAEEERFGRSWVSHLLGNGVALASGIVLGVGFDRPEAGIANFAAGLALSEVQILTQPTRAMDDWRRYRRDLRQLPPPPTRRAAAPLPWSVAPSVGGLAVAGSF